ncbi:hypothetical protein Pint_15385 [Pistacia integerrima]|uniref:Uncharacterized protein n=1 Tax=Pistacia integerrima TaxID=434235 RepID=A0ACC0ZD66_9ROSI|nr:hypothetical protein Pint_15385 [Pistacia integerrima]
MGIEVSYGTACNMTMILSSYRLNLEKQQNINSKIHEDLSFIHPLNHDILLLISIDNINGIGRVKKIKFTCMFL